MSVSRIQTESYRLLENENAAGSQESLYEPKKSNTSRTTHGRISKNRVTILFIFSAVTNVLLASIFLVAFGLQSSSKNCETHLRSYLDVSPYAQLARQPSFRFPYSSGYGPTEVTNHTLADERWEAIDIDPGIVAVPLDWAEEHNLAETQPFPWDPDKRLYVVNAFHSIHCLKIIHRIVYDAHHGRPLSREIEHVMHCIDHMRKDAMCNADDFLLPTPPNRQGNPGPRGQSRICKNWDALVGWAGEHDACYQHITDDEVSFARDHHEIERYMNCPPGSPYASKMQSYLNSKGEDLQLFDNKTRKGMGSS